MSSRLIAVFAALLMVGACSTTGENTGDVTGSGQAGQMDGANAGAGVTGVEGVETASLPRGNLTPKEELMVEVGDRVFFDFDSFTIRPEGRATLERQAQFLQRYPNLVITIEGHADERGTREYNLALGERRAQAVREYLVALGVSPARINTVSFGKERPAVLGSNNASWAQNRRSVTRID